MNRLKKFVSDLNSKFKSYIDTVYDGFVDVGQVTPDNKTPSAFSNAIKQICSSSGGSSSGGNSSNVSMEFLDDSRIRIGDKLFDRWIEDQLVDDNKFRDINSRKVVINGDNGDFTIYFIGLINSSDNSKLTLCRVLRKSDIEYSISRDEEFGSSIWFSTNLPYELCDGCAVEYCGDVHILGGANGRTKHYRFDKSSSSSSNWAWVSVSTLPYDFAYGAAVVYNNEIHILGGYLSPTKHYKWDGSNWINVSTLPYPYVQGGQVVVYKNSIHLLGGIGNDTSNTTDHYKWNGSSWSKVSTLPYEFYNGSAMVFDDEIHVIGGYDDQTMHCSWDGASWKDIGKIGDILYGNESWAIVFNNEIHAFNTANAQFPYRHHYKYAWTNNKKCFTEHDF